MITPGVLCPFGDGRHKLKPWAGDRRSGVACTACHKTWEHVERSLRYGAAALVETWELTKRCET